MRCNINTGADHLQEKSCYILEVLDEDKGMKEALVRQKLADNVAEAHVILKKWKEAVT